MKTLSNYIKTTLCLIATLMGAIGCSEEYEYQTDYSFYEGVTLKMNLVDENNMLNIRLANKSHFLTIAVEPETVFIDPKAYIYEIEDPTLATISADGTITLLKSGSTKLTAKYRGNQNITTSCTLNILPTYVTELQMTTENIRVEEGKQLDLSPMVAVLPSDADNKNLTYTVKEGSEEYIAIEEGSFILQALKKGSATVLVSATDGSGISIEMPVEVTGKIPVEKINLNRAENIKDKTFAVGQSFDLASVITTSPANASDPTIVYEVISGNDVISLDAETGLVKAIGTGEAEIRISAHDEFQIAAPQTIKLKVGENLTWYERAFWFVDTTVDYEGTGHNYIPDGTTGFPEHLIDGKNNTYLALVKPEKGSYNGHKHPSGAEYGFIVDMGGAHEFNTIQWTHRNTDAGFQAQKIRVSGSNDNVNYEVLEASLNSTGGVTVEIPLSATYSYRYVKVEYIEYDKSNKSNLCVAEFNVGKK